MEAVTLTKSQNSSGVDPIPKGSSELSQQKTQPETFFAAQFLL